MKYKVQKGQVSLEYLMTYGIAIAIVVIAVAALYSMGVFSPTGATVGCSPCFSYFAYSDYSGGTLLLLNGANDVSITGISCSPDTGTACNMSGGLPASVGANDKFNITGIDTSGDIDMTITYTKVGKLGGHTDTATIHN